VIRAVTTLHKLLLVFLAREGLDGPSLIEWMEMTQEELSARFKGSPIKRAKRRGLLRKVAVAPGNWGAPEAIPALVIALHDEEPLVRGHEAWALGRIGTEAAWQALRGRGRGGGGRVGAGGGQLRTSCA
jgi:epoxyqueuosine reductase